MTDVARVDLIFQHALLVAGEADDFRQRELGPIHLLKYVYLADLAYADRHGGQTFTSAPWRFHHFGPWTEEVYERIEPTIAAAGATERRFTSTRFDTEGVRYQLEDEVLLERIENQLPGDVTGAIRWAVRRFGTDTASLLDHIYLTRPMLRAAPGERLDFTPDAEEATIPGAMTPPLSTRDAREHQAAIRALRERFRERVLKRPRTAAAPTPPPRYDAIFWDGVRMLDELAGEPIGAGEATLTVADDVWKSRARRDRGIP